MSGSGIGAPDRIGQDSTLIIKSYSRVKPVVRAVFRTGTYKTSVPPVWETVSIGCPGKR